MNSMKVAVCITSYGRVYELGRQIYAMMDQSYKNLHVFVAAKGYTEAFFKEVILPPFQHFIDEGRLTLRLFPNSNMLSNFVDTIRELNVDEYELFLKVDDDDLYHRDYVKTVVELLDSAPPGTSSGMLGESAFTQRVGDTYTVGHFHYAQLVGCSLCLSPACVKRILQVEEDRDALEAELKTWKGNSASMTIDWAEDRYFAYLANANGCLPYGEIFAKKGIVPYHVGWMDHKNSVTRSNLRETEFGKATKGCAKVRQEWIQSNAGTFKILEGKVKQEGKQQLEGHVLSRTQDTIVVKFADIASPVTFKKNRETGYYHVNK